MLFIRCFVLLFRVQVLVVICLYSWLVLTFVFCGGQCVAVLHFLRQAAQLSCVICGRFVGIGRGKAFKKEAGCAKHGKSMNCQKTKLDKKKPKEHEISNQTCPISGAISRFNIERVCSTLKAAFHRQRDHRMRPLYCPHCDCHCGACTRPASLRPCAKQGQRISVKRNGPANG